MNPKVKTALNQILELFKSGDVPAAISIATFPKFDVPSNAWSLSNRIIMAMSGTSDARGYKMWLQNNRYVKKGSKTIYILAPWINKKKNYDDDDDAVEKKIFIRGFLAVPVFRVEDTDGDPLDYEQIELPELPLIEVAELWGLDVGAVAYQGGWLGYYRPDTDQIRLATPEEKTFFHELSHAAHKRVIGELKNGQDWKQEIVAELSAQTLCHIVGANPGTTIGNSFDYISHYASKANKDVSFACMSVLSDVEKVLSLILAHQSETATVLAR
ncbi:antirestriction protein [bacterium]|nr:antirestriction protein [bacterium]